jgi:hypothetical protein
VLWHVFVSCFSFVDTTDKPVTALQMTANDSPSPAPRQ